MMTIEEKAKAYDEALERAKNFIENGDKEEKTVAESIFAGLIDNESEDKRIRKAIIGLIEELQRSDKNFAGVKLTDMLAYLEKQKDIESKYAGMVVVSQEEWDTAIADAFKHGMDEGEKQKEQPEVDLEKEIYTCFEKYTKDAFGIPIEGRITKFEVEEIAHHFYELGLNARKEE